jgi:hypothetical protein
MEVSDFGEDPSNAKTLVTCKKREFELSTEQLTSEISYPREIHINIYAQAAASILLLRFLFLLVFFDANPPIPLDIAVISGLKFDQIIPSCLHRKPNCCF